MTQYLLYTNTVSELIKKHPNLAGRLIAVPMTWTRKPPYPKNFAPVLLQPCVLSALHDGAGFIGTKSRVLAHWLNTGSSSAGKSMTKSVSIG